MNVWLIVVIRNYVLYYCQFQTMSGSFLLPPSKIQIYSHGTFSSLPFPRPSSYIITRCMSPNFRSDLKSNRMGCKMQYCGSKKLVFSSDYFKNIFLKMCILSQVKHFKSNRIGGRLQYHDTKVPVLTANNSRMLQKSISIFEKSVD